MIFSSPLYTTSRVSATSGWVGAILPAGCYTVSLGGTEPVTAIPLNTKAATVYEFPVAAQPGDGPVNRANANTRGFEACTNRPNDVNAYIGLRPPGSKNLAVRVWHDLNANGRQDTGERGIPGFSLTISDILPIFGEEQSRVFPTKTTTSTGWVGWAIPRGTCGLVVVPGEFYAGTSASVADGPWSPTIARQDDRATQSDWMGPGAPFCISNSDVSLAIGLINLDELAFAGPVVTGTVWTDTNGDGQRQSSEPLVSGGISVKNGTRGKYLWCNERSAPVVNGK